MTRRKFKPIWEESMCALCENLWPAHKLRGALTRDGAMCLICPDCEKEYGEVPLLKLSTKGQQKWQAVCGKEKPWAIRKGQAWECEMEKSWCLWACFTNMLGLAKHVTKDPDSNHSSFAEDMVKDIEEELMKRFGPDWKSLKGWENWDREGNLKAKSGKVVRVKSELPEK